MEELQMEVTVTAEQANQEARIISSVNRRSEIAEEIISHKAGFIERWALLIFLGILVFLLALSWFIRYPDFIETRASLTAANAPKEIVPRQEGRLVKLFVRNNEKVKRGDVIGWIESTADHHEVMELSSRVDSSVAFLESGEVPRVSGLFNRPYNNLGEIQERYQSFITVWQQFNDYLVNGFYPRKVNMLRDDIRALEVTSEKMQRQKLLIEQDVKLAEETFDMNRALSDEKVLSKEEFRVERSKYLSKQMQLPQLEVSLIGNETQKRDKLKEIYQLNHDIAQQRIIFQQALQSLKSVIDDWKKRYVLQSPVDGNIFFIIPLQENQFLQPGKLIGYINPDDSRFYAETYLPQNNFGKASIGLKVQLRFDAYPYQEAGFVDGTINYISHVASDSGFLATVQLDHGLVTNTGRPISYKSGLTAQAIVITRDLRLLQRLWFNLNKSVTVGNK